MWMFRWLDERPSYFLVSLGLLLAIDVSGISYLTGWEYTVTPLYLLPITLVSYHVGRWAGLHHLFRLLFTASWKPRWT
jgi:hypothetical protein